MRILMVNKYYHLVGGVERYAKQLTCLLEQKGHQVIPFAMADPQNEPTPFAKHFVTPIAFLDDRQPPPWRIAERVIYSREARRRMAQLIEETRPEAAHLHNIYHHISPSILHALRQHGIPILMTLHDYKLICPAYKLWSHGKICERCHGGRFYQCVLHRCSHDSLPASLLGTAEAYAHRLMHIYDTVDLFISPSKFLQEKHIAHGLAPDRIVHIPNFLSLEDYPPCFEHEDYFVYAGRLTPFKGIGTLLEAVSYLALDSPLVIAGDGPSREALEVKAAQLGLANTRFLGHQSGIALRNLIAKAMFVVVPSEWYENCPYAVLEALALGTPVVATAVGGIPELVEDGVNGLLVPPGAPEILAEGLERMCKSRATLSEMGHAGRERVERIHSEQAHFSALSYAYAHIGVSLSW